MRPSVSAMGWVVVNTQPHRENFALENLRQQDFEVYCPMVVKRIRHARRAYDACRPMFPGYIFVGCNDLSLGWRPLLGTYGVRSVLRSGDTPSLLDNRFVEALKAREVNGAIIKPSSPFAVGHEVAIRGGAFDGLCGRIVELRDHERVMILLQLLSQQTKVQISADMLNAK